MKSFKSLRFPKTTLTLYIIAFFIIIAFSLRIIYLGAVLNLPPDDAGFMAVIFPQFYLPILTIAAAFLLASLFVWFAVRHIGYKFRDIYFPFSLTCSITIFIFFHFTLLS